ncbi:MAG TPA: restriction endonuclease subunit S [Bacteroidia bacterium]|nr:restriction endonuclease subunit S [Bacteroidia bacterium]
MELVKLGAICDFLSGNAWKADAFTDNGVPIIRINNLNLNDGDFVYWNQEYDRRYLVQKNDILLSLSGTIKVYKWHGVEALLNQRIVKIKPKRNINIDWVYYKISNSIEEIINKAKSATIKNVSVNDIKSLEVLLPDLETQNKIVAILDKAKTILDKREETIRKYDELLRATFLEMFGDPILNPKHWQKQKLEEITTKITDGKHGDCEDELNSGFYFISAKDLLDGKINYNGVREITEKDFIETHRRTNLQLNDILIGNTGASIGKLAIVTDEVKAARTTFQKSVAIVTVNEKIITPSFLYSYLLPNRDYLEKISSGSGQKNLLLSQLRNLEIITPPLELQQRFTSIVFKIENLKQKHKIQLQESHNLYKTLSQLSFKGELDFNTAVDLEVLLENDYQFFKENSNISSIKLLLERLNTDELNEKRFYEQQTYDKAKSFVFELIKEGRVKQVFDEKTKKVKLTV